MPSKHALIQILREAGNIRRCHNIPHHHPYTVGHHSYGVASIILLLHPDPSLQLVKAALWHDAPERYLGDLPAPAKWYNPALAVEYGKAEDLVLERLGLRETMEGLSEEDQSWLHGADRLELLLWCYEQRAMGNSYVANVQDKLLWWYQNNRDKLPAAIQDFFDESDNLLADMRSPEELR